jgi:ADP-ribose pyrophosphatase YjhB (NUDIX family)
VDQKRKWGVLYTKRDVEPYKGLWHLPGSFLLKGETVSECVVRLAKEELGLEIKESNFKLRNLDEDLNESRGHVVHLVYEVWIKKQDVVEDENKMFCFEPPKDMIPTHRKIFLNLS